MFVFTKKLENQVLVDDRKHANLARAYGDGLRQAQVGVPTSFTVDTQTPTRIDDDEIKVVVTSKISTKLKINP